MITDAKYIEQGFSREILDQLDPMNEGIIGDIINKFVNESTTGEPEIANINYSIKEVRDTDAFFNPSELETNVNDYESKMDGLSGSVFDNSGIVDTINNMVASILPNESPTDEAPCNNMIGCTDDDCNCCESFHSFNDNNLMHLAAYEAYLESCVENETKLHNALLYDLGVLEESSNDILLEVRIQDTVKNKWEVFKNFILRTKDRFQDSISNLLDKNRRFLEKYKDNIINTKPADTDVEYNGDYPEAVNRCLNTPLPVFNYERDAQWLRQDGYEGAVKDFMAGKGIKYNPDDGGNLGNMFKDWFLAAERGKTTTKLSSLNFKAMYDFCYNSNKIINSLNRDIKAIDQSTNQLLNAVNKEVRERGENTNKNQATNPQQQTTGANQQQTGQQQQQNNQQQTGAQQSNEESYIWMNINEADEEPKAGDTGLKVDNNNPQKKDENGNTENNDNKPNQKTTTTEQDMTYITGKWVNICRYFLTAKMTVIQQISKDYMDLIRIHLRNQNIKNFKDLNNEEPKGKVENNKENNNGQEKQGEEKGNNQQQQGKK